MSLSDVIDAELGAPPATSCRLCWHLQQMPESDREAAERGLSSRISNVKMAEILTSEGYPVSVSVVGRHRQREHAA